MRTTLRIQALKPLPGGGQTVTSSGTSAQSSAVGDHVTYVKIASSEDIYVEFGDNPTATTSSMFIAGDKADRYFLLNPGEKVAVLQVTAGGTVWIHQMTT